MHHAQFYSEEAEHVLTSNSLFYNLKFKTNSKLGGTDSPKYHHILILKKINTYINT